MKCNICASSLQHMYKCVLVIVQIPKMNYRCILYLLNCFLFIESCYANKLQCGVSIRKFESNSFRNKTSFFFKYKYEVPKCTPKMMASFTFSEDASKPCQWKLTLPPKTEIEFYLKEFNM